jgi:hypothetical protein
VSQRGDGQRACTGVVEDEAVLTHLDATVQHAAVDAGRHLQQQQQQ